MNFSALFSPRNTRKPTLPAGGLSSGRQKGFTLIEASIYVAVLAILGVPIIVTVVGVSRTTSEGNLLTRILERNRTGLARVSNDYRRSLAGTTMIGGFGKTLTFTIPAGFDGTGPITGNTLTYGIRPDPEDPSNGKDDNGNGVIDEGVLVRVNQTTGETITVGAYLDSANCGFAINGTGVEVTLTTIGWAPGSQVRTRITRTMVLYPRN